MLVRVKILRCGFVSAGAGKFFGAGNNINDLFIFIKLNTMNPQLIRIRNS